MTVRIVELETELAASAFVEKLTEGGLTVAEEEGKRSLLVELPDGNAPLLATIISEFAFSEWLYACIEQRMEATHPYLTEEEREYVSLLTFHGLRKTEDDIAGHPLEHWRNSVQHAIERVLNGPDTPHLNVDGVMRFRSRALLGVVDTAIHEMVEQFLADREYEEFVSMLRYMLEAQPPTTQIVHVFCGEDQIWLTDETGQLLKDTEVSKAAQQATEDGNVNSEDLAMSILITRSPCSIVIHDLAPAPAWPSFAETLERVFMNRAVRCKDCSTCTQLKKSEERLRGAEINHQSAMPDKYE